MREKERKERGGGVYACVYVCGGGGKREKEEQRKKKSSRFLVLELIQKTGIGCPRSVRVLIQMFQSIKVFMPPNFSQA